MWWVWGEGKEDTLPGVGVLIVKEDVQEGDDRVCRQGVFLGTQQNRYQKVV